MTVHRRHFLAGAAGAALLPADFWRRAIADTVEPGVGPYGPLSTAPNADGLRLPAGFSSRVVARGGDVVGPTDFVWPKWSDGAGTFATADGGWVLTSNSEVGGGGGGVSAIAFAAPVDGVAEIVDAYALLRGTSRNCAGGITPWGTWLSCEEVTPNGRVWECDPLGRTEAAPIDALGRFSHEAAAVDPATGRVYLTEDERTGRLFRFTPLAPPAMVGARPSFDGGVLEVAAVGAGGNEPEGSVRWVAVDPADGATHRPDGTRVFDRLEGAWFHAGHVYVTATTQSEIYDLDVAADTITRLHDGAGGILTGADNIIVHAPSGDLFIGEDGGNMELVIVADEGARRSMAPFLAAVGHPDSEITGPVFDPSGTRLYVSSQRGGPGALGVVWEITGPFRAAPVAPETTTTTAMSTTAVASTTTTTEAVTSTSRVVTVVAGEDAATDSSGGVDVQQLAAAAVAGAAVVGVGTAIARGRRTAGND